MTAVFILAILAGIVATAIAVVVGGGFRSGKSPNTAQGGWEWRGGRSSVGISPPLLLVAAVWAFAATLIVIGLVIVRGNFNWG